MAEPGRDVRDPAWRVRAGRDGRVGRWGRGWGRGLRLRGRQGRGRGVDLWSPPHPSGTRRGGGAARPKTASLTKPGSELRIDKQAGDPRLDEDLASGARASPVSPADRKEEPMSVLPHTEPECR